MEFLYDYGVIGLAIAGAYALIGLFEKIRRDDRERLAASVETLSLGLTSHQDECGTRYEKLAEFLGRVDERMKKGDEIMSDLSGSIAKLADSQHNLSTAVAVMTERISRP